MCTQEISSGGYMTIDNTDMYCIVAHVLCYIWQFIIDQIQPRKCLLLIN